MLIRFESPPTWKASKTVINWRFSFKWERPRWKAQSLAGKEWSTSPGRSKSSHVTIFEACFSLPWLTTAYYDYLILCISKIKKGEHNCSQFFWHQIKVHRYIHVTVTWMYNLHPLSHRFYQPRIDTPTTPLMAKVAHPRWWESHLQSPMKSPHSVENQHSYYKHPQHPCQPLTNWAIKDSKSKTAPNMELGCCML